MKRTKCKYDIECDACLNESLWGKYEGLQQSVIKTRKIKTQNKLLRNRINFLEKCICLTHTDQLAAVPKVNVCKWYTCFIAC